MIRIILFKVKRLKSSKESFHAGPKLIREEIGLNSDKSQEYLEVFIRKEILP